MSKLLIVSPAGVQEVIEIGRGGAYFDLSKVLWDERIDGPLPDVTIGGAVRIEAVPAVPETEFLPGVDAVPASLVFDQSAYDSRVTVVQVPQVVTMAQAQKALVLAGVDLAAIDAAIEAIQDDTARALAKIDWNKAATVRRDSALVASMAQALGLTSSHVNQMFITAAAL